MDKALELLKREVAYWQFEYDLKVSRQMDPMFELSKLSVMKEVLERLKDLNIENENDN